MGAPTNKLQRIAAILIECDGATSVDQVATSHKTTRQTIYRWRKSLDRNPKLRSLYLEMKAKVISDWASARAQTLLKGCRAADAILEKVISDPKIEDLDRVSTMFEKLGGVDVAGKALSGIGAGDREEGPGSSGPAAGDREGAGAEDAGDLAH